MQFYIYRYTHIHIAAPFSVCIRKQILSVNARILNGFMMGIMVLYVIRLMGIVVKYSLYN